MLHLNWLNFVTVDITHMLFGNLLELCLLAWLCFVHLMLFSVSDFLVLVASPECKIGLLHIMAIHIYKSGKNLSQGRPGTIFTIDQYVSCINLDSLVSGLV